MLEEKKKFYFNISKEVCIKKFKNTGTDKTKQPCKSYPWEKKFDGKENKLQVMQ